MRITLMKKSILTFALALALILSLVACGGRSEGEGGAALNDEVIADYAFVPTYFALEEDAAQTNARSMVHGERIYYFYAPWDLPDEDADMETWEPSPRIVISSVAADGTDLRQIEIPMPDSSMIDVAGLAITDEGHYALLYTDTVWDMMSSSVTLFYAIFDADGNKLFAQEIEGVMPEGGGWFHVDQTLFADDYIVLLTQNMGAGGAVVYLLDANRTLVGRLGAIFPRSLIRTGDGRVFVLDMDDVRELNLETRAWGEPFPISIPTAEGLLPATDGDDFDIIIDDGIHLIGYNLTTEEQTLLLNWIEAGVVTEWGYRVSLFADGRLAVLSGGELIILNRVLRSELPVREVLTLGGFDISAEVRNQIVAFNRSSQTHQIQVTDYRMYSTNDDPIAGITRFHTELAAGGGPDVVVGDSLVLGAAVDRGFLADLYPFLDADPALRRSDFFQNILRAMEAADGTLPLITNSFSIQTMIGMAENVAHIESWTLAAMLELIEQTTDENIQYILGEWLTGESFLSTILMFGEDFINRSEGQVNLENEEFINLLEIVRRLPEGVDFGGGTGDRMIVGGGLTVYERMQRGEQLLAMTHIHNPMSIQMYTAAVGDVVALGVPTPDGGAHLVNIQDGLGINLTSPHQDKAWDFIRLFLLPEEAPTDGHLRIGGGGQVRFGGIGGLSLRIDQYEEAVAAAMEPVFFTDEYGVEREQQRGMIGFSSGLMLPIYSMTAEEASTLRTIVESADLMGRFDETVTEMVREELLPFLAGDRSAADTARILQNRLQTYLSERRS